jgi:predicted outer membrane lipoprotein
MVSSRRQLSPCPVCNRADQVRKMQTAYEAGELHIAPPPMPESHVSMMKYVGIGMILVGLGAFFLIIMLATSEFSWIQLGVTLACIVAALALSFLAIRQLGKGDEEARQRYPVWDQAMANWTRLQFCARDKVVFDPQSKKVLPDSAVKALIDMDRLEVQNSQTPVAVSH